MLTKSDFLLFLEAPMHLWAKTHGKLQITAPSTYDQHLMKQGYDVEKVAHEYLERFVLATYKHAELLWQQTYISGKYQTRADGIIHDLDTDNYHIYEIKSSTSEKKDHLPDATFQSIVIGDTLTIGSVHLVLLNDEYVRGDSLDIEKLFKMPDVTQDVSEMTPIVLAQMREALAVCKADTQVGVLNCLNPKCCPCLDLCHKDLPTYSIYNIPNLTPKKRRELEEANTIAIDDIDINFSFTPKQQKIVDVMQSKTPFLDKSTVRSLLHGLTYPLYFLDYETYDEAMPLYKGHKPYQKMVFQYSLHIVSGNGGEIQHEEYVATETGDPAYDLVRHLRSRISDTGSVIVWNKAFEGGRNKEISEQFPEHKDFLLDINNRMFDLMEIVSKGYYVHPDFRGSWSIKNVLPVMVPELSYKDLSINKGDMAMIAWWEMVNNTDQDKKKETSGALLKYCGLDTLAMVKIWEKLCELTI
ncbi:MAG: hypothetical protein HONDAALG_04097 [Gammaproteobacteria bacterium]|nr:hypothetical protein [Gammaproteobacteria bacterium]